MGSLLQQQPPPERHGRNGYSVMLKLFRSVKHDNQATAQTELVTALRQAAKLPATLFCIAESGRNLNSLRYIETLFDNEVTLRFILEKVDLLFPLLELLKNVPLILITEQALDIANSLIAKGIIPAKAAEDALHIAYCLSQWS